MFRLQSLDLVRCQHSGVIVFVASQGQSKPLNGIGEKTGGFVVAHAFKCLQHAFDTVATQVSHQGIQRAIVIPCQ